MGKAIRAFFFYGDAAAENHSALDLLDDLANNPPEDMAIIVERIGESDTFKPTVLWDTITFVGIAEITKFCAFMKKGNAEKNEIAKRNFSEGIIGF